jgi:hypothetical protein
MKKLIKLTNKEMKKLKAQLGDMNYRLTEGSNPTLLTISPDTNQSGTQNSVCKIPQCYLDDQ